MFGKRKIKIIDRLKFPADEEIKEQVKPYTERTCQIYISEKFNEILFVPQGKMESWILRELDSVIIKKWPIDFGELQECINLTINKFEDNLPDRDTNIKHWYSYNKSKAKTQKSFKNDYFMLSLRTDIKHEYGSSEVERIIVEASPYDRNRDTYKLTGTAHLLETRIAQIVLDIYKACKKIRD